MFGSVITLKLEKVRRGLGGYVTAGALTGKKISWGWGLEKRITANPAKEIRSGLDIGLMIYTFFQTELNLCLCIHTSLTLEEKSRVNCVSCLFVWVGSPLRGKSARKSV